MENPQDEVAVMGRICHVGTGYGIIAKGYYLKLDDKGQCSLIITQGKKDKRKKVGDAEQQALIASMNDNSEGGERILAMAQVEGVAACQWHTLKLRFEGNKLTGFVDGQQVVTANSMLYPRGMAGLMAPMQEQRICTPYFDNVRIMPVGPRQATSTLPSLDIRPLYQ